MGGALNETLSIPGMLDAVEFDFVPWGNAYFNTKACHTSGYDKENGMVCWVKECGGSSPPADCFNETASPILCQHGDAECDADMLEACAFDVSGDRVGAAIEFLVCYEGVHGSSPSSAPSCARAAGLDFDRVQDCVSGSRGAELEVANAQKTAALGTAKLGTPWVYVDGQHLDDPTTLKSVVCAKVSLPGCSSLI